LETSLSVDEYRFTVGGADPKRVIVDLVYGTANSVSVFAASDMSTPLKTWTMNNAVGRLDQNLDPGEYVVRVFASTPAAWNSNTYQLRVYGVQSTQTFPLSVTNGSQVAFSSGGAGSANLETRLSKDVYTFSVSEASDLVLSGLGVQSYAKNNVGWELAGASGVVASGKFTSDARVPGVVPGSYTLTVTGDQGGDWPALIYSGSVFLVPPAQSFQLGNLGSSLFSVSSGVPGAGAGKLETSLSVDEYRFTVGGADPKRVIVDTPSYRSYEVSVFAASDLNTPVKTWGMSSTTRLDQDLDPGEYVVRVFKATPSSWDNSGTYQMRIYGQQPDQTFSLSLSDSQQTVVSSSAGTGAGALETRLSKDVYTFTLANPAELVVNTVANSYDRAEWKLVGPSGTVVSGKLPVAGARIPGLEAGVYTLTMTGDQGKNDWYSAWYSFNLKLATPS